MIRFRTMAALTLGSLALFAASAAKPAPEIGILKLDPTVALLDSARSSLRGVLGSSGNLRAAR